LRELFVVIYSIFVVIYGYSYSFRFNVSMKLFDIVEKVERVDKV